MKAGEDLSDKSEIEESATKGSWILCPHCHGKLLVGLSARVTSIHTEQTASTPMTPELRQERWRAALTQQQIAILDSSRRSGLFDSFVAALERGPHNGIPNNKEKYFMDWMRMCKPRPVPAWALNEFRSLYADKYIEFYGWNFIGAVVAGGEISLFLPIDLINGTKVQMGMDGTKRMSKADVTGVRQWLRTKMGYVPQGARIALAETQKRSIGEYANPVL